MEEKNKNFYFEGEELELMIPAKPDKDDPAATMSFYFNGVDFLIYPEVLKNLKEDFIQLAYQILTNDSGSTCPDCQEKVKIQLEEACKKIHREIKH
jgi:hypothetical protein